MPSSELFSGAIVKIVSSEQCEATCEKDKTHNKDRRRFEFRYMYILYSSVSLPGHKSLVFAVQYDT